MLAYNLIRRLDKIIVPNSMTSEKGGKCDICYKILKEAIHFEASQNYIYINHYEFGSIIWVCSEECAEYLKLLFC